MLNSELLSYLAGTKRNIALNVLFRWFALSANITVSFLLVRLLSRLFTGHDPGYLYFFLSVTALWGLRYFFERKAELYGFRLSEDVKKELRHRFFRKIISIGPSYNQKMSTSKIMQLAGEGVEQLQTYYAGFMPQLYFSMLATLTMAAVIFFINVKTSLVLLVLSPVIPLIIAAGLKIAGKILGKYWKSYFNLGSMFLDSVRALTMLKTYSADGARQKEMDQRTEDFRKQTMKLLRSQLNSINMMDLIAFGGLTAGIITALFQLRDGNVRMPWMEGDTGFAGMVFIILLCYDFFVPLRILGSLFHVAMNGIWASTFISGFLALPADTAGRKRKLTGDLGISIRGMSYSFGENRFIQNLGMDFPARQITAVVGRSGCGKSTISNIVSGLVTGYEGSVKIGGIENRDIHPEERLKQVNVITHQPFFFKGTVRDNLSIARKNAGDEEMNARLEQVNLLGFLREQNGLDTQLGDNADNLSGGQKQRLAIARALLQDPGILIFDEATSSIEEESEDIIMSLISRLAQEKTIVLISHRLSNVVNAHRIYYMEEGKITGHGTHAALMAAQKEYSTLYTYQKELENYGKYHEVAPC